MGASASYPSLREQCVFITGGATGIGAALVKAFTQHGARVAFVDIDVDAAAPTALLVRVRQVEEAGAGE